MGHITGVKRNKKWSGITTWCIYLIIYSPLEKFKHTFVVMCGSLIVKMKKHCFLCECTHSASRCIWDHVQYILFPFWLKDWRSSIYKEKHLKTSFRNVDVTWADFKNKWWMMFQTHWNKFPLWKKFYQADDFLMLLLLSCCVWQCHIWPSKEQDPFQDFHISNFGGGDTSYGTSELM